MDTISYLLGKKSSGGGGGGGSDLDWTALGYAERPSSIDTGYNYGALIKSQWNDIADLSQKYSQNRNVVFFPKVTVTKATNTSKMFYYCYCLMHADFTGWDTSKVANMSDMFRNCYGLTELDLSSFTTEALKNTSTMFSGCSKLKKIDIRNFDFSGITTTSNMFASVPTDCLILVKDASAKTAVETIRSDLTNVQIAS